MCWVLTFFTCQTVLRNLKIASLKAFISRWHLVRPVHSLLERHFVVGFTRIAVNFKFHSWFANFKLNLKFRVRVDDSWFRNWKLTSSYETTRTNLKVSGDKLRAVGGPTLEVYSGRINAQTSRFHQLEVRSDLSNYSCASGSIVVCVLAAARVTFSMHIVTIMRTERTLKYFRF